MGVLDGKAALVTGAGSGIGRACAEALGREGARVLIGDVAAAAVEEVAEGIRARGGVAQAFEHDVTSEAAWADAMARLSSEFGGLDVLVNNAGIAWAGSVLDMSLADWRGQTAVNLDGVFLGVRAAIPLMRDSGGGSIINISSVAGLKGSPRLAGYCATKGGVRLFTKAVARECAENAWGIRVNSVHPGIIETAIWESVVPGAPGENSVDVGALAAAAVPGGRLGQPHDIANGVVFLASDNSSYMNGAELVIDAGLSA